MNSYIDRQEIVTRLSKSFHPDNLGVICFYDAFTKERIKDLNIEVVEKGPDKINTAVLVGLANPNDRVLVSDARNFAFYKLRNGGISFEVYPDKDYQITVIQDDYVQRQYVVNWRELLLNPEVGIVVSKLDCKKLSGIITSKNVQLDMANISVKLVDKTDKNERSILLNAWGGFSVFAENNKSYVLEIYEGNVRKHTVEMGLLKRDLAFKDIVSRTKDFDFVLQESIGERVLLPTKYWSNEEYKLVNYNQDELLAHFLGSNSFVVRKGMVFQLSNYYYDYITLEFSDPSKKEFDLLDQLMRLYPSMKVSINVHTDTDGSASFNQRFTYDIAEKISRYLGNRGIDRGRILSRGMGEAFLLENTDPSLSEKEKNMRNRRVEVEVLEF